MPKVVDHEQYRKELLRRSLDIFAEKGFGSVKMRELAQALDISTGSLYYYFPDKDKMFEQLIETLSTEDMANFSAVIQTKKSPTEKFDALINFIRDNEASLMKQTTVLMDFYRQKPGQRGKSETIRSINDQYKNFANEQLGLDDDQTQMLTCIITGLLVERFFQGNTVSIKSVIKTAAKLITK